MNNQVLHIHAQRFAERLERESGGDKEKFVRLAFEHAYARIPSREEATKALTFLSSGASPKNAQRDFCQALFNSNEFVYIP